MDTERPSPRFADIDLWQPTDVLEAMIGGQFAAVAAVRAAIPDIARASLTLEARLRDGGRLVYVGAGTSGRLAVQDGAELMPTFGWPNDRLVLLIAGGEHAMTRAVEGAEDATEQAIALMAQHRIGPRDAVVAVAASGTTPFTLECLRRANALRALTIGLANNRATPLLCEAKHPIFLETGAEPIAGSTRMNAGTAQRIALTLLSTLVMIRLGRVYRGLMVEVQATNEKLTRRKESMLQYLSGKSNHEAREALQRAGGDLKVAVLVLRGSSPDRARTLLENTGGHLRAALDLQSLD
jgi:N-acetylmuramic acid 6-phosphate etherase